MNNTNKEATPCDPDAHPGQFPVKMVGFRPVPAESQAIHRAVLASGKSVSEIVRTCVHMSIDSVVHQLDNERKAHVAAFLEASEILKQHAMKAQHRDTLKEKRPRKTKKANPSKNADQTN